MAAGMAEPYRACPQSRAEQRNQNMKTSMAHLRVFYCPNLAIRAVTRARRPALDDQFARWLDIDAVTGAEYDAAAAGGPRHADAAVDDEDRCLCAFGVHRPFGAAHRRNRLRRHHVEPGAARLLRHFEQQGLVAEFDGIDMAVAVAIPELELRAAFGHDRDRRRTMKRLRSLSRLLDIAAEFRWLGCRSHRRAAAGLKKRSIRRVPALSWQLPLPGTGEIGLIRYRITMAPPRAKRKRCADNVSAGGP